MKDEEWERWQEWLEAAPTQAFLSGIKAYAEVMKTNWAQALWQSDNPESQVASLTDLRARSQVCEDLSNMDRETLTEILSYEHDRN